MPYTLIGQSVDLRVTVSILEAFDGDRRVTSHALAPAGVVNEHRTHNADLPDGPRYREWTADRAREWAGRIGPNTITVINRIFEAVPIDEQGLDPALAVLRLTRRFSAARVEAAAGIALASRVRSPRYAHLRPILDSRQDCPPTRGDARRRTDRAPQASAEAATGFVRGADYYAGGQK